MVFCAVDGVMHESGWGALICGGHGVMHQNGSHWFHSEAHPQSAPHLAVEFRDIQRSLLLAIDSVQLGPGGDKQLGHLLSAVACRQISSEEIEGGWDPTKFPPRNVIAARVCTQKPVIPHFPACCPTPAA